MKLNCTQHYAHLICSPSVSEVFITSSFDWWYSMYLILCRASKEAKWHQPSLYMQAHSEPEAETLSLES